MIATQEEMLRYKKSTQKLPIEAKKPQVFTDTELTIGRTKSHPKKPTLKFIESTKKDTTDPNRSRRQQ
nr:hypothetical protein HmN_000946800 [Hymenolepis microstoma]